MRKKSNLKIKFFKNVKIKKVLSKIMFVIIFLCVFYNILYLINTTITNKEYFNVSGISIFTMDSNNMTPDLNKNDLIIAKEEYDYKVNDIIVYKVNEKIRINKISNIKNQEVNITYNTKSNTNYYNDIEEIVENQIIGKVYKNIGKLGFLIKILQSKMFTIIIIIIIILKFYYNKYIYQKQRERRTKKINFRKDIDFSIFL